MTATFVAFTFLLVAVNLLLTVTLVRIIVKIAEFTHVIAGFLSQIRFVQISLVEKAIADEMTHDEMRPH